MRFLLEEWWIALMCIAFYLLGILVGLYGYKTVEYLKKMWNLALQTQKIKEQVKILEEMHDGELNKE